MCTFMCTCTCTCMCTCTFMCMCTNKWSRNLQTSPKLRTYITYKTEFCVESYVYNILNINV